MRDNNNDGAGQFRPNRGIRGEGSKSFGNKQNYATGYRPQGRGEHSLGGYRPPRSTTRGDSSSVRPQVNISHTSDPL